MPSKKDSTKKVFCSTDVKAVDNGEILVTLTKEQPDGDRDGEIVSIAGGKLENFRKNPVMLWGHRMIGGGVEDVMGSWKNISVESDRITANPSFADHPKAAFLKDMVLNKHISTVSIGMQVNDYDKKTSTVTDWELLEASWVTVPANVDATAKVKQLDAFNTDLYQKLINYKDIHPKIKQYRKLFLAETFLKRLKIDKSGNELIDIKSVHQAIVKLLESKETPKAKATAVTPQVDTKAAMELIGMLGDMIDISNDQ